MTNKGIYDALRSAHLTAEGACAVLGNMAAESGMRPDNAQDFPGIDDRDYTTKTDNGLNDFVTDSVGYGLCQWTLASRKRKLLTYAKARGVSIGDAEMQTAFCILELQADFPSLYMLLFSSHDLYECTKQVCYIYENPAVKNVDERYKHAQQFYNAFCGSGALAEEHAALYPTPPQTEAKPVAMSAGKRAAVMVMQMTMNYAGYWGDVTGETSPEFFSAARQFIDDLEK